VIAPHYALTPSGLVHRYPAWESCNLDDARQLNLFPTLADAQDDPHYRRLCRRCFKEEAPK
jgi:hypothetical protein